MDDLTAFDDLVVDSRARIRIAQSLRDAEPGYPRRDRISEVLSGTPVRLFVGANRILASSFGVDLTSLRPPFGSVKSVCEKVSTTTLVLFSSACVHHLESVDRRAWRIAPSDLRQHINQILLEHSVSIVIAKDCIRRTDEDDSVSEVEQKFGILGSSNAIGADFNFFMEDMEPDNLPISLLYIDIDRFKSINGRFGETTVDKTILPEFQTLLKRTFLKRGLAYRHGGEEFVVLLPNHTVEEAMAAAERFRHVVENQSFFIDEDQIEITVSIGVSSWPINGASFDEILSGANQAEHQAKGNGRNRVEVCPCLSKTE